MRRTLLCLIVAAIACGRYPVRTSECGTRIAGEPEAAFITSAATVPDPTRPSVVVRVREHAAQSGLPIAVPS